MEDIRIIAKKTGDAVKKAGADKAWYEVANIETQEFNVDGGSFSLFRTMFDNNLIITAYKDDKKGTVSINRLDDAAIEEAALDCIKSAESGIPDKDYALAPAEKPEVFKVGTYEPDVDKLFERSRELMDDIKKRYPKIMMEQLIVSHKKRHEIYCNTNGTEFESFGGFYEISMMFLGKDGEKSTSFASSGAKTASLDVPFIELGTLEIDLADAEAQLDLISFEGKFEGVAVLTPASLGQFLSNIRGNFLGDQAILNKTSIWLDKLGQKVADERLTISLSPYDARICDGQRYTAEGFKTENFDIIKNGELKSFVISQYIANKSGFERAKNISGAVVIEGGDTAYQDMIRNIKKGIIVGRFSGGQPSINGDFSGVAKNSFLVEDGKIKGAVSETMINGNLAEMLKNVVSISKETAEDGESVLPYIAVDGIIISGK